MRKRLINLVSACIGAALLAACGGANSGFSPTSSTLTAGGNGRTLAAPSVQQSVEYPHTQNAARSCNPRCQMRLSKIPIASKLLLLHSSKTRRSITSTSVLESI